MSVIVPFVEAIVTNQCRHRRVLLRSLPPIRSLSFLRAQTRLRTKAPAEEIAPDVAFEEESYPSYNPQAALEVHPGDVLNGRYETTAKLGYGTTSTIWLARDLKRYTYVCSTAHPDSARSSLAADGDGNATVTWC